EASGERDAREGARDPRGLGDLEDVRVVDELERDDSSRELARTEERRERGAAVAKVRLLARRVVEKASEVAPREEREAALGRGARGLARAGFVARETLGLGRPVARAVVDRVRRRDERGAARDESRELLEPGQALGVVSHEEGKARDEARRRAALAARGEL